MVAGKGVFIFTGNHPADFIIIYCCRAKNASSRPFKADEMAILSNLRLQKTVERVCYLVET
jgi:hypothetical protein